MPDTIGDLSPAIGDQPGDYDMPTNLQNFFGGDQPGDYDMPTNAQTPGAFGGFDWSGALKNIGGLFTGSTGGPFGQMAAFGGLAALLNKVLSSEAQKPVGYQGGIPAFTASRQQIARPADYQPGMGGVSYFTPMQYRYAGQDIGGGKLGASTGTAQGADPLQEFLTAMSTAAAAAPAASPAPAPTPSAAPAPSPATQVATPATQTGTTMKTQNVTGGTADTTTKTATTATTTGWIPGMTTDVVQWRNAKTGETRTGSSSDIPPSSDWNVVRTTTTMPGSGTTTAGTTATGGTGGTQFNLSRQDVTDLARQNINPDVATAEPGKATRAQVLAAYANNPLAELNPSESAIQYWMGAGLDNFNQSVLDVRKVNPDLAAQIDAARGNKTATTETKAAPTTVTEKYFANPLSASELDELANKATYTIGNNIIRSGRVGVELNDSGEPGQFVYYDPEGRVMTKSAFLPKEFLKYANDFGINPTDLLGVEKGLTVNKIAFKPYDYFGGTGSDHGIDFRDLLTGGMGTAYDWTQDPGAATKGPTGLSSLKSAQDLASKFGLKYNQEKYKGGGIDVSKATQLQGGKSAPMGWAVQGPGNGYLSWYESEAEAKAAATQNQGKVVDLTGTSVTSQDNRNNLTVDDKGNFVLKPGGAAGGLGSIIRGGYAAGGLPALQSAGGRFLRGPGDGVSDSIPAKFDRSGQPARLADGEFVLDARTVSEIGNGSSEAGARKLYAMMDRIHKARKKAGRGKDSGADKYLPA